MPAQSDASRNRLDPVVPSVVVLRRGLGKVPQLAWIDAGVGEVSLVTVQPGGQTEPVGACGLEDNPEIFSLG